MKKILKITFVSLIIAALLSVSLVSAFAAESATVNGQTANVGDTVTYTFSISDCKQNITGIHMDVFFDQEILSLEEVNADNLTGSLVINDNKNNDGVIIITNSMINGAIGLKCEDKTTIVTITFKVIKAGETDITYYVPYLYDLDMVNIYDYTFSYDMAVAGNVVIEDKPPVLAGEEELAGIGDLGDFANNEEGTGSGEKPQVATQAQQNNNNNAQQNNNGSSANSGESGLSSTAVWAIVISVVIVLAIVVLIVVKVKFDKKGNQSGSEDE
ncbi:MAG: cohesin domain-containing protein [Ruminococcus sp.]